MLKLNVQLLNAEFERNPALAWTEDMNEELKRTLFSSFITGLMAFGAFWRGKGAGSLGSGDSAGGWGDMTFSSGHRAVEVARGFLPEATFESRPLIDFFLVFRTISIVRSD